MAPKPSIQPKDWITIGQAGPLGGLPAVVCQIYEEHPHQADCEIVFVDHRDRATKNDVRWTGSYWDFVATGDYGVDAEGSDPYVQILRKRFPLKHAAKPPRRPKGSRR